MSEIQQPAKGDVWTANTPALGGWAFVLLGTRTSGRWPAYPVTGRPGHWVEVTDGPIAAVWLNDAECVRLVERSASVQATD